MYCDTAQAKPGNITYLWSCLSSLGPRANSISDLWWMVWQEGVTQIVMLTNIQEGGKVGRYISLLSVSLFLYCSVQFNSTEDGIYEPGRFPNAPGKKCQCSSYWRCFKKFQCSSLVRSFKVDHRALLFLHLATVLLGDGVMFLGFVPAGTVSSASTTQIFRDVSHLWWLLYPQVFSSWLQHVQGSTSTGVFDCGCQTLISLSLGFPFPFSYYKNVRTTRETKTV